MDLEKGEHTPNVHFTYKTKANMNTLCQGDVLTVTDELADILEKVHPYFLGEQYKYFIVLTQSCDLIRRKKYCKSPYITLAAVRSYSDFLKRELVRKEYAEDVDGYLLMDTKNQERARQFIERIYNNTEDDYFFLYKEEELDFPDSMVAYLKVSIALKSKEHYDACLKAKKLELADEFKAKLGWLVGNMYSRVGTPDWESNMKSQEKKSMIEEDLKTSCIIGYTEQLRRLKNEIIKGSFIDFESATDYVTNIEVKTKYDEVMDIINQIIKESKIKASPEEKEILFNSIKSRKKIKTLIN